jgi:uroporphyrin-3 C-methyltransferase
VALQQAQDRLQRQDSPALESVRRVVQRDLEQAKARTTVDTATWLTRIDELVIRIDDLPLVAERPDAEALARAAAATTLPPAPQASSAQAPAPRGGLSPATPGAAASAPALSSSAPASSPLDPAVRPADALPAASAASVAEQLPTAEGWWWSLRVQLERWGGHWTERVWNELRGLVRVTRIDHPEAVLISPEQAYFLRENLKLRLLNARLALLSRQFETTRADLRMAHSTLTKYFDPRSPRNQEALTLLSALSEQVGLMDLPRVDDTLAALVAQQAVRP